MDFNEWLYGDIVPDEDNVSIYQLLREGQYGHQHDIIKLLEEAYEVGKEAGWTQAGDYL